MFPADVKTFSGGGVTVTKSTKKGSISYSDYVKSKSVPEEELEPFRGKSSSTVRVTIDEKAPMPEMSEAVQLAVGITDGSQNTVTSHTQNWAF